MDLNNEKTTETTNFYIRLCNDEESGQVQNNKDAYNTCENLLVKPFTTIVRRLSVNAEKYLNINQIQSKYRSGSKIQASRNIQRSAKVNQLKVNKKRRNHLEIRAKTKSSSNTLWSSLNERLENKST